MTLNTRTTMALRSGRLVDLLHINANAINLDEIAERLGKTGRFGNAPRGAPYSVAQHCVLGADAIFEETGIAEAAGDFVLHDAHEYVIGDKTTPVSGLFVWHAAEKFADLMDDDDEDNIADMREAVSDGFAAAKAHVDKAICEAAGWWPGRLTQPHVKNMDMRMLLAEMRMLWKDAPEAHDVLAWCAMTETALGLAPVDIGGPTPFYRWPRDIAAREWLDRLHRYCGVTP